MRKKDQRGKKPTKRLNNSISVYTNGDFETIWMAWKTNENRVARRSVDCCSFYTSFLCVKTNLLRVCVCGSLNLLNILLSPFSVRSLSLLTNRSPIVIFVWKSTQNQIIIVDSDFFVWRTTHLFRNYYKSISR